MWHDANGVGLGLMIYELVDAIKNNYSPVEVNKLAQQLVSSYRHWVCPLEFDFVKNHRKSNNASPDCPIWLIFRYVGLGPYNQ